jgi:lipopolysaccharide export system permease protein
MTRIDRYILVESLPTLLFGLILYSCLAVVSATLVRLQWIADAPVLGIARWLLWQFPAAVVWALPVALVLSVLLTFGRLSAGNELLAMQVGAISLRSVTRSLLLLGVVCALSALSLNEWVLPHTNAKIASSYWRLTTGGKSGIWRLAQQNLPVEGMTLTFDRVDRVTEEMFEVRIERWQDRQLTVIFADRAIFEEGGLRLIDYQMSVIDLGALEEETAEPDEVLSRLVRAVNRPASQESSLRITTSTTLDELIARYDRGGFEDPRSIRQAFKDARDTQLNPRERRLAAVLWHRKLAEPFANLSLLLVSLPLSILYGRSRGLAFGLSLVVTLGWYVLLTFGQAVSQAGTVPVWFGLWFGNVILSAIGAVLMLGRIRYR